jgi:RHS repeat-associated protein
MAGISSKAAGGMKNKWKFNDGTELESEEFSNGSGLELYATEFRSYDAQIGRFHQIDALSEITENWSPYSFAFANPISFNDPLGLTPIDSLPKGAPNPVTNPDAPRGSMENPIPMPEVIIKQNPPTFFFLNPEPTPQWNPTILTSEPNVLPKGSSEFEAGIAASILILPRLNPAGAIVTLGVASLYVGYSLTLPPSSALGPHYFNATDNTIIFRPPFIFKAEDKTDYMGKARGNTPGNNQSQNKQVDALSKQYKLSPEMRERLHRRISKGGYGYKEIEKIIKENDY